MSNNVGHSKYSAQCNCPLEEQGDKSLGLRDTPHGQPIKLDLCICTIPTVGFYRKYDGEVSIYLFIIFFSSATAPISTPIASMNASSAFVDHCRTPLLSSIPQCSGDGATCRPGWLLRLHSRPTSLGEIALASQAELHEAPSWDVRMHMNEYTKSHRLAPQPTGLCHSRIPRVNTSIRQLLLLYIRDRGESLASSNH
jgi:hypothetical protein